MNAAFLLKTYAREVGRGIVVTESGFYTERHPDSVRGPDVSFYARRTEIPEGYFEESPDLVVEVVSPRDRFAQVEERVLEFLRAGVKRIWVALPRTRTVHVYGPERSARILQDDEVLSGDDVLPGFECPVRDLFDL